MKIGTRNCRTIIVTPTRRVFWKFNRNTYKFGIARKNEIGHAPNYKIEKEKLKRKSNGFFRNMKVK